MAHSLKSLLQYDPARHRRIADGLVVATLASLPWSTSATSILVAAALIAILPLVTPADWRDGLRRPSWFLPVLLVVLGIAGMAWASVPFADRWEGLGSFFKLLALPVFMAWFRTSDAGPRAFAAYAISCTVLLVASYAVLPTFQTGFQIGREYGVPVKNAASQSGELITAFFGLLYVAYDAFIRRLWPRFVALAAAMLAMLANMLFIATGRTALVLLPVLLALFALKRLSARGIMIVALLSVAVGAVAWTASPYLRVRVTDVARDIQTFDPEDARNSTGERLEFARKSLRFIAQAPVIGHGTGTIHDLFKRSANADAPGAATTNPHNQTFAVGIQLGLMGMLVLWAMWIVHLLLFRGPGLAAWIGALVVVQNIVGSLFNSHLFDFLQGWVYLLGVGIAGGMMMRQRAAERESS